MITAQIDQMVRAAVARAGYSEALVPELRDQVAFHILMSSENATPRRIGLLIDALLPGMQAAMEQEAKASGFQLTISNEIH